MISEDLINQLVGINLKFLRRIKKVSQKELGEALGVTAQQIQKYESGKNSINSAKLLLISVKLSCKVEDFFATERKVPRKRRIRK